MEWDCHWRTVIVIKKKKAQPQQQQQPAAQVPRGVEKKNPHTDVLSMLLPTHPPTHFFTIAIAPSKHEADAALHRSLQKKIKTRNVWPVSHEACHDN
jgi:hypothetical protein